MANREHLQVLEQGVEAWNAWRNAHENVKPDLSGANLSGGKYEGINFSGADLRETNLRCARLREANLADAALEKADLSQAVLENARLEWADLFEADLRETRLFGACLRETNLGKANLSRADLGEVDLQKAILNEAYLSKARLVGADLRGANLSKANLYRADLSGANLQGVDLHEAVLSRSRLVNADLRGARITAVNLIRAQLQEADLSEADLSYADLSHSRVRGLVADNAILEETTQSSLIVAEEKEIVVTVGHVELVSHVTHMLQNGAAGEFPPGLLSRIVLVINCMTTGTAEPINAVEQALGEQHLLPVIVHLGETARQQSLTWAQQIARVAAGVVILGEEAAAYTPVIEGLAEHSSPRAIRVLRFNQSPEHPSAGISSNSRNSSEREDRQATVETFPAVEVMDVSTPERLSQALSGLSLAPAEVGETPPIPPAQEQKTEPHLDQASPTSQNNEPVPPSPEGSPSPASEPIEEDIIAIPVPENSSAQEVEATTAGEVEETGELPSEQTGAEVPPVP
ncbi:MAG: pentapeptide repeat-containing protein, partial [Calditrichaeota bacterium]